jgi:polysaccharide biosynthesis protein PslH
MRILQLTNKPPWPDKDGGAIATLNLTRGFSRLGHDVTVLSMNTLKHHVEEDSLPAEIKALAEFRFVEVKAPISAAAAAFNLIFSKQPYNAVRFMSEDYGKALISLLKEKKFDIIHLEGLYLCPYIPLLRKYSKAVIAYRAHNIEFEIWQRTAAMARGWRSWYMADLARRLRRFEISMLNQYDLLVPITPRDGHILAGLGNSKPIHVSPAGVDLAILKPDTSLIEYPSLFHLGSLEWPPNQEGLVWFLKKCWPPLRAGFPELKFYVAGRKSPDWLTEKLKLPGVVFEGEVTDAYHFMNSKAVMVVPLLSGSGMRVKIIEGMALGKSIVSTSIGAEGLGVTNGTNILVADDPETFVDAASKLLTDRNLFDSIGKESIRFVKENFDNLSLAEKLCRFYQSNLK